MAGYKGPRRKAVGSKDHMDQLPGRKRRKRRKGRRKKSSTGRSFTMPNGRFSKFEIIVQMTSRDGGDDVVDALMEKVNEGGRLSVAWDSRQISRKSMVIVVKYDMAGDIESAGSIPIQVVDREVSTVAIARGWITHLGGDVMQVDVGDFDGEVAEDIFGDLAFAGGRYV